MTEEKILSLYFDKAPNIIKKLDLCRGELDFREVIIAEADEKKLVIKHTSNSFCDKERIVGWSKLIDEYNNLGIYSPRIINNKNGDIYYSYEKDGRTYYVYAEEFAEYETAEQIGDDKTMDENGIRRYRADMLRSVGKVAAAHLDTMDFSSVYCLMEPFCRDDPSDEGRECLDIFCKYINENLPEFKSEADELRDLFDKNETELRKVYDSLPTSCFQSDLNWSNVLLDSDLRFKGLIDYNLSGKEKILNYTVRAALWHAHDNSLHDKSGDHDLYYYDKALDDRRMELFLKNLGYIEEFYTYTDLEREAFPHLLRYMNSVWWGHIGEIKEIKDDKEKVKELLSWLKRQMTRDDIRLP